MVNFVLANSKLDLVPLFEPHVRFDEGGLVVIPALYSTPFTHKKSKKKRTSPPSEGPFNTEKSFFRDVSLKFS